MKILVFGAAGFLGEKFLAALPQAVGSRADVADEREVTAEIERWNPAVVLNCAGKTGRPNIDWCEEHRRETLRSNVTGALVLLDACLRRGVYFAHLGSGCVYEGDNRGRGFAEDDAPNFFGSFYSRTKAWADRCLAEFPVLILRVRMPFDGSLHPRTLLGKLIKYNQVLDAPNSITYLPDFLQAARQLIEQRQTGIFHIVNPGVVSPYQIMQRYAQLVDPGWRVSRLTAGQLDEMTRARRSNCQLSSTKLTRYGITLQPVDRALDLALAEIAHLENRPSR